MENKSKMPKVRAEYNQYGRQDLSERPRHRYGCVTNALGIAVHAIGPILGGALTGYAAIAAEQALHMIPANALTSVNNALEATANASLAEKAIVVGAALIGVVLVNHFTAPSRD